MRSSGVYFISALELTRFKQKIMICEIVALALQAIGCEFTSACGQTSVKVLRSGSAAKQLVDKELEKEEGGDAE